MIPLRVELRDFLCFSDDDGDPIVFDFRTQRLWSIWGDNGAGKSAIFDAVTYVLFGVHRGGKQADEQLIRKGARQMSVCFEFDLKGVRYQAYKSIKLRETRPGTPRPPDRACQLNWWDEESAAWRAVPRTESKDAFHDEVKRRIGFGYETFVASCMLLQGQSDRLILAEPRNRFEILAGVLDLRVYERLAEAASVKARSARNDLEAVQRLAASIEPVDTVELARIQADLTERDEQNSLLLEQLTMAAVIEEAARQYQRDMADLAAKREQAAGMTTVLKDKDEVLRAYAEYQLLRNGLPKEEEAITNLRTAEALSRHATQLDEQATAIDLTALEQRVVTARSDEERLDQVHADAFNAIQNLRCQLDALRPDLELAQQIVDALRRVEESVSAVGDFEAQAGGIGDVADVAARLEALAASRPILNGLIGARQAAHGLQLRIAALGYASTDEALAQAENVLAVATVAAEEAQNKTTQAQTVVAKAETALEQAQQQLAEREGAGAEGTCSRCGQKVTAEHIQKEIKAARQQVEGRQHELGDARDSEHTAREKLSSAREYVNCAQDRLTAAQELRRRVEQTEADITAWTVRLKDCENLPADVATAAMGDVDALPALATHVDDELQELPKIRRQAELLRGLHSRLDAARESLDRERQRLGELEARLPEPRRLELQSAADGLRTTIHDEERELVDKDKAARDARAAHRQAIEALQQASDTRGRLSADAEKDRISAAGHRDLAESQLSGLPVAWIDAAHALDDEFLSAQRKRLDELSDAEERHHQLLRAEREFAPLDGAIKEADRRLAGVPDEHRVPVREATANRQELERKLIEVQDQRTALQRQCDDLDRRANTLADLEARQRAHARERLIWNALAKHLGRGGLQAALMKEALVGIEQMANETLRRVSVGRLELRLEWKQRGDNEEIAVRAMDYGAADDPLDIAFLSGGQKFRAAVAIAAGIGQYAGLGPGGVRSLIVDEGFGSLDTNGRREMIEELKEIAGYLDRVIVVSHQEAFQDRSLFPAVFELRREDRETVVARSI